METAHNQQNTSILTLVDIRRANERLDRIEQRFDARDKQRLPANTQRRAPQRASEVR